MNKFLSTYMVFQIVLFLLVLSQAGIAQNGGSKKYVKLAVSGVKSSQEAKVLSDYIQSHEGVFTSRMDFRTKIFFGVFTASSAISLSDFKVWIHSMGFEPECGFEAPFGEGHTKELSYKDCNGGVLQNNFVE